MNIKELKAYIQDLPDDTQVLVEETFTGLSSEVYKTKTNNINSLSFDQDTEFDQESEDLALVFII